MTCLLQRYLKESSATYKPHHRDGWPMQLVNDFKTLRACKQRLRRAKNDAQSIKSPNVMLQERVKCARETFVKGFELYKEKRFLTFLERKVDVLRTIKRDKASQPEILGNIDPITFLGSDDVDCSIPSMS